MILKQLFLKNLTAVIGIFILGLLFVNMYLFSQTVVLADTITKMEDRIEKLHAENRELNKTVQASLSLETISSYSSVLNLTSSATALKLEKVGYASR